MSIAILYSPYSSVTKYEKISIAYVITNFFYALFSERWCYLADFSAENLLAWSHILIFFSSALRLLQLPSDHARLKDNRLYFNKKQQNKLCGRDKAHIWQEIQVFLKQSSTFLITFYLIWKPNGAL